MSTASQAPNLEPVDRSHPYHGYDPSKCIGCGRCVRYAQNVACCDALELTSIAGRSKMQPRPGRRLIDSDCLACGGCLTVCQQGALFNRRSQHAISADNTRTVDTHCPLCTLACPVAYTTDADATTILNARPLTTIEATIDPNTGPETVPEPLCPHAAYAFEFLNSNDRLTAPVIKIGTRFQPVARPEAIRFAAREMKTLIQDEGPDALGVIVDPTAPLEDILAVIDFASMTLGVSRLFFLPDIPKHSYGNLWADPAELLKAAQDAPENVIILNLVREPLLEPVVLCARIKRLIRAGAKYIACDPAANTVNCHNIAPSALLAAVADTLANTADPLPAEPNPSSVIAPITQARKCFIIISDQTLIADEPTLAPNILSIHAADADRFRFIIHSPNVNSIGLADYIRRHRPAVRLAGTDELLDGIITGTLHGLYMIGSDPVCQLPGGKSLASALAEMKFIASHAAFLTQSARLADIVFPMPTWPENPGCIITAAGRIAGTPQIVTPHGDVRSTHQTINQLAGHFPKLHDRAALAPKLPVSVSQLSRDASTGGTLRLIMTRSPWHRANGELTRNTQLIRIQNYDALVINPADASIYDLADGGLTVVGSANAQIVVPVVVSEFIREGWATISNYFSQTCAQTLWPTTVRLTDSVSITVKPFRPAADQTSALTAEQRAYIKLSRHNSLWQQG